MSGPAGYEYFDVAADVGVRAWAPTVAEAFAQAALGVFALTIAPEDVQARETREIRAQGDSREGLLVSWINECLYLHEVEAFAVHRVEVVTLTATLVHGKLHGEEIDTRRHRRGTVVKAATYHRVTVRDVVAGEAEVRVIVDV
jgi:SHS2 domain-containing protein